MGVGFVSSGLCAHKHCSDLLSVSHEHLSLSTGASNFRTSTGRHLDSGWDGAACDCLDKNPDETGAAAAMDLVCLDLSLQLGRHGNLFDQGSRNAADSSPSAGTAATTSSYMAVYHAHRGPASLGRGGNLRPCSRGILAWNTLGFLPGTVSTTGTIIACPVTQDSSSIPTVSFQTQAGQHLTFRGSEPLTGCIEGETVPVVYHPTTPQDARIESISWLGWIVIGSLSLLLGLYFYVRQWIRKARA